MTPRPEMIAALVGNRESVFATPRERAIAAKLRKIGEEMEKKGYLPEIRRQRMRVAMQLEIQSSGSGSGIT